MNIGQVCAEVKNYFVKGGNDIHSGGFTISGGVLSPSDFLIPGQYFRVVDSVLNDGVYQFTGEPINDLSDEVFAGQIWAMRVPGDFEELVSDISTWNDKYGTVDSANMSPYNSESYAGQYSYSKSGGGASGGGPGSTWQSQFASRLAQYRRLSVL